MMRGQTIQFSGEQDAAAILASLMTTSRSMP